jgi:hypothetical protein
MSWLLLYGIDILVTFIMGLLIVGSTTNEVAQIIGTFFVLAAITAFCVGPLVTDSLNSKTKKETHVN